MLDEKGFTKKTYSEIIDEMNSKAKELFGEDVNTNSYSILGIIIRIIAWFLSILWDGLERVYNSRYIKKSDGIQLDYHGGDKNLKRNPATNAYTTLNFTGLPGYVILMETQFGTTAGINFMLTDDVTLDSNGNGSGEAVSIETGNINNVPADTITEQVEPVEEIYTVTNPEAATGGADQEDNASYKQRLLQNNESNGKGTANAIITALLNTPGVRSATAVFNKTMEPDADGNPPKSVHAYVLGGNSEDIAASLFDSVSGTSQTVGQQQVTVKDLSGVDHVVCFDWAEEVQIYLSIDIKINEKFESNGADQIKDSIIAKIGGTDSTGTVQSGLNMGESVILSQLYACVYQVVGIDDVTITTGTVQGSLSSNNIAIAQRQVAVTTLDNIEVIINA